MKLNKPYMTDLTEEAWLLQRKLFITATEASALMGINPYVTASKLLREKPLPPTKLVSPYLDRGLENEQSVLDKAAEWLDGTLVESQGFYANPETRISATPDGILADGRMIEAKCTGIRNLSRWNQFPPVYYIMQCQVQMYVVGAKENYLHARFFYDWPNETCEPGADRMYKIEYNPEIISICIDKVKEFWYSLDNNLTMRADKASTEYHTNLLKSTCEMYRGQIIMQGRQANISYQDGQLIRHFKNGNVKQMGNKRADGYVTTRIEGKNEYLHRAIWEYHNGRIPEDVQIDHINRDRSDNRIENLRLATPSENRHNNDAKGYSWHKLKEKWAARLVVRGTLKHLGYFDTETEAREAYIEGKEEMLKFEIEPIQLSIIRQTCLKAAAKMCPNLSTEAVIELAYVIEEKIFFDIAKGCEDNSRNFLIQIGAAVNGYVEGHHNKDLDIQCLRHFVVEALKYITRK